MFYINYKREWYFVELVPFVLLGVLGVRYHYIRPLTSSYGLHVLPIAILEPSIASTACAPAPVCICLHYSGPVWSAVYQV